MVLPPHPPVRHIKDMEKEFVCSACANSVMAETAPATCPACGKEGTMTEKAPGTDTEGSEADSAQGTEPAA